MLLKGDSRAFSSSVRGAISIALGLGATAWQYYATSAESASRKAKESTEDSTSDILLALDKQIQKIKDLNRAAAAGYDVKSSLNPSAVQRIMQLTDRLAELKKKGDNVSKIEAIDVQGNIDDLNKGLETLSNELDKQADRTRGNKASEWMLQYANDAEKMAAEIQKARNELGDKFTPELEKRIRAKFTNKPAADDTSRKILDGQIKALEAGLAREKDLLVGYENFLRDTYSEGGISVQNYYDRLQAARDENLRRQLQAYDDEIAATELFYERSKKEVDKQDALNKIDDIRSKRTNLLRDAGLTEQALNRERIRTNQEYLDTLNEINAKILELNGNTAEAARIRFEASNRILNNSLANTDSDAARNAQAQQAILLQQAVTQGQLADALKKYSLITDELSLAQARLNIARDSGASTELQNLYQLSDVNKAYVEILKEQLRVAMAIAAQSKDPTDLMRVKQLEVQLESLSNQTDLVAKKFNDVFTSSVADALYDAATGAKTLKEAFLDMAKSISSAISRIAANNLAEALFGKGGPANGAGGFFSKLFAGNGGGGSGLDWILSLFGFGGSGAGSSGLSSINIPGLGNTGPMFGAASGTNFAVGGRYMVGEMGPEEVWLPRGAKVTNNHDTRRMSNNNVTININAAGGGSTASHRQLAGQVRDAVIKAIKER
jgi:hypothetical protein